MPFIILIIFFYLCCRRCMGISSIKLDWNGFVTITIFNYIL